MQNVATNYHQKLSEVCVLQKTSNKYYFHSLAINIENGNRVLGHVCAKKVLGIEFTGLLAPST